MNNKAKKITFPAIMAALSVIDVYIACVFPTGQLGILAVGCLFVTAAVVETGLVSGIMVYAVSSVLSLLIAPSKFVALMFIMFFGYYPIVKSLAEKIKGRTIEWGVKLLVFNAAAILMYFTIKSALLPEWASSFQPAILLIALNVIFVIFDIGLSKLISFYINRVSKNFR